MNTTIFINNDTSNQIAVECSIRGQKENGSWYWEIERIISVELQLSNGAAGVDITNQLTAAAKFCLLTQVNEQDDQIIDALEEEYITPKPQHDSLFEQFANITRAHAKIFYGIDLMGGGK